MQGVHIAIFAGSIDQPIGNWKARTWIEVFIRIRNLNLPTHHPGCGIEGEHVKYGVARADKNRIGTGISTDGGPDTANSSVMPVYVARYLIQRVHRATII